MSVLLLNKPVGLWMQGDAEAYALSISALAQGDIIISAPRCLRHRKAIGRGEDVYCMK